MKRLLACIALAGWLAGAQAAPPTAESVERLLVLSKSESVMDSMYAAAEAAMRQAMQQAVGNKRLTAEQERAIQTVPARYMSVLRAELNWATLKPDMIQMYQDVFTQEEIDGMIAFIGTPAGQAMMGKMPALMQRSMVLGQTRMRALMPRMLRVIEEALNDAGIMTR
ncbi:MAG: DUF2059 domain-containing protein [Burkholderiales bacterium]|nr:DUF2059 domain-containing protein [Burkholderiales bacterium]